MIWKPLVLLDPFLAPREATATAALTSSRDAETREVRVGGRIGFGQTIATVKRPLFVRASVEETFRFDGSDHFVLGLRYYDWGAGVCLGRFELGARVGLHGFDLHFGRGGFAIGGLSPQAMVSASVRVGGARIALGVFTEQTWVWIGDRATERLAGASLTFAWGGRAKGLPPFYRLAP